VEPAGHGFSGISKQVAGGRPFVISASGESVPEVPARRRPVCRQGRGSLRGHIRIPVTFDEPRASIAEAFGMR
jgi:hypothetical protein